MLKRVLILGLLALGLSGEVLAQQSETDAAAARALGKQEFAEVVRLYAGTDTAQLDDRALYRLAIAEFRLGNQPLAASYLDRALRLNPKGSFASSPERLRAWQKDIGPVVPQAASAPAPIPEATPATDPVAPAPAVAASEPAKTPAVTEQVAPATVSSVQPVAEEREGWAERIFGNAELLSFVANVDVVETLKLLVALIGGAAFLLFLRAWVNGKEARHERQLHRKLFERLQEFRVEAGQIHGAIQAAGRTDTDIHAALSVLLKALDGEIGRSFYFASGKEDLLVPADAETLEVIQRLRPGPMRLSSASGAQVKALFQTSQRAI